VLPHHQKEKEKKKKIPKSQKGALMVDIITEVAIQG
jgi:hypothetical protein